MAVVPHERAQAIVGGGRSDPVLVVNGALVDVFSDLATDSSSIRELDYRVTVPAGSILNAVRLTVGIGFPERVTYVFSRWQPWGTLRIDATVITQPGVAPFQTTVRVYRPLGGRRGAEFLARYPDFRRGIKIVLHHHERIDGAGYPGGLRGDDIPYGSRVIAVADSFDAMTSDRPYRGGMSIATATEVLTQGRGTQWDSTIVDAFISQVLPVLLSQSQLAPPAPHAADTTPVPGAVA